MQLVKVIPSTVAGKKWTAIFQDKEGKTKRTSFGAAGMDDYTLTHDKEQRERYRKRHEKDLRTHDYTRAGYLSYWILWGPSTSLKSNIAAYKRKMHSN